MSVQVTSIDNGPVYEVVVTEKLHKVDYETFVPLLRDGIAKFGKIRLMLDMQSFHGWDAGAFWEDLKFGIHEFNHFDRIAMVGDKKWEKVMSVLCKPFVAGTVKYFDHTEKRAAKNWLLQDVEVS